MAAELVAGSLVSASLQVLFQRLASEDIPCLFQGKKVILDQLDELNIVLLSANVLLNDAEEKQVRNDEVRKWLFELQDVIYQADDLLDRIDYEALRSKLEDDDQSGSSNASKVLMKFIKLPFLSTFDKAVKLDSMEILRKLKILVDQKDALGLREGAQNKPSPRSPAPLVEHADVYGRDVEKELIVDLLLTDEVDRSQISVIPIVGMGGVGKTTLAQLVYDDERVQSHFDLKVWVTVSDEFNISKITREIYEGVTGNKCDTQSSDEMIRRRLKMEILKEKKFLFVHDDVWNESYSLWDSMKSCFESGANGSKIIVTTRSTIVASTMATGHVHHLQTLLDEDCWQLFVKHAFGNNVDHNSFEEFEELGRKIVEKCKGLPLTIKSLGGLLRSERNAKKWEDILHSDTWEELYKKEGSILPALWLSYRHLPTHLKQCFAYCSIFPKDYEFEREKLILLWMAEGFLPMDTKSKKMEEFGKEYVEDLLLRSLFIQRSAKKQSTLYMHDLVHDLATLVSNDFCFRLHQSNDLHCLSSKTRHLSYTKWNYDDVNKFKGLDKAKSLRSFVALPLQNKVPYSTICLALNHILVLTRSCLRVLSLSESSIKELPDSIGNLIHLRYLDLSFTKIEELPDSLCSLYNLQTLLLSWCEKLSQLPNKMGRLINLRYLNIERVPLKEMPQHIGNMKNLHFLSNVVLSGAGHDKFQMKELGELDHLQGKICFSGLENIDDVAQASEGKLKDKKVLSKLCLSWNEDVAANSSQKEKDVLDTLQPHTNLKHLEIERYRGTTFSDWIGDSVVSNLVSISIIDCKNCCVLPPLGQLAFLKELKIAGCDSVISIGDDEIPHDKRPLFGCLEDLRIENMLVWKDWSFAILEEEGQILFPLLKTLWLDKCPKLGVGLPCCYLPSLESLSIDNCREMEVLVPKTQQTVTTSSHLSSINISNCPVLESLLHWGSQSKVKELFLWKTKVLFEKRMQWDLQKLTCLVFVNVCGWEGKSFPDEGLFPVTLRALLIQFCSNLETLNGKAFQQLTSLTSLDINNCENIHCLPEGLPASLSQLSIYGCPLLKQRCENGGQDWPKIEHIATLYIY